MSASRVDLAEVVAFPPEAFGRTHGADTTPFAGNPAVSRTAYEALAARFRLAHQEAEDFRLSLKDAMELMPDGAFELFKQRLIARRAMAAAPGVVIPFTPC